MNLDDILKQLSAIPILDQKESTEGLWETTEEKLFQFLKQNIAEGFPYPIFCSPVGGYVYLYFVGSHIRLPLSVKLNDFDTFLNSLNSLYKSVVNKDVTL